MQSNPPGPGTRRPLKLPQGARGPQPVRSPVAAQQGAGLASAQRNELIEELATLAEGGSSNPELLQYTMGKGLDRENAIALIKRAKRLAQDRQAGDMPPGMGGGEVMGQQGYVNQQPVYGGNPYQGSGNAYHGAPQTSNNNGAIITLLIGLGMIVAGVGISVASYSAASGGGRYSVFYGLIIVGIITCVKGAAGFGKG